MNIDEKIPKRLRKEPLIEALWQLELEPKDGEVVTEVLPGLLFTALRQEHPKLRVVRLPAADIPSVVTRNDPSLRRAPKFRIEEEGSPFLYQIGDHYVSVNCKKPYAGWKAFKAKILRIADILSRSGLGARPIEHALRYLDLLTLERPPAISHLQLSVAIGSHRISRQPLQIRVEVKADGLSHVVQIATPATVALPGGKSTGTLIDIETRAEVPEENLEQLPEALETLHDSSKRLFFKEILTPDAVKLLEPEY